MTLSQEDKTTISNWMNNRGINSNCNECSSIASMGSMFDSLLLHPLANGETKPIPMVVIVCNECG